jgi:UDP-N-acetylglucosamine 4,6-dehydratase/5-epimerase
MNNAVADKTILVTGGTGSIGSEIVKQALLEGARQVIVFSRDEIKHYLLRQTIADERLLTVVGDIRNMPSIEPVFDRYDIDIIYNAAAMKHVVMCEEFPYEATQTNINGTRNIVDLAIKHNVAKTITISTDKAANPINILGATKLVAERLTLNANQPARSGQVFACVRFGNVAGSRGSVIPVFAENLISHKPLRITDRNVSRFTMEIPDAVKLIFKATQQAQGGEVFILKMKALNLGDLLDVFVERIAPQLNLSQAAIEVVETGLIPGEKLREELINESERDRLYELDEMYVILPSGKANTNYPGISRASISRYSSGDVELISRDEIEKIILKYLNLK